MPLCLSVLTVRASLPTHISRQARVQVSLFHSTTFTFARMPPKKKGEEPKRVILGRPGNNLKVSRGVHDASHASCTLFMCDFADYRSVLSVFPMSENHPSSTLYPRQIWVKPPISLTLPCKSAVSISWRTCRCADSQ